MSNKTKAELEQELAEYRQQADEIADVLSDDGLRNDEKLETIDAVIFDDDDE